MDELHVALGWHEGTDIFKVKSCTVTACNVEHVCQDILFVLVSLACPDGLFLVFPFVRTTKTGLS